MRTRHHQSANAESSTSALTSQSPPPPSALTLRFRISHLQTPATVLLRVPIRIPLRLRDPSPSKRSSYPVWTSSSCTRPRPWSPSRRSSWRPQWAPRSLLSRVRPPTLFSCPHFLTKVCSDALRRRQDTSADTTASTACSPVSQSSARRLLPTVCGIMCSQYVFPRLCRRGGGRLCMGPRRVSARES